jgi:hypothetical protein
LRASYTRHDLEQRRLRALARIVALDARRGLPDVARQVGQEAADLCQRVALVSRDRVHDAAPLVHRGAAERLLLDAFTERALDQRRSRDHHLRGAARHHGEVRRDQPRRGQSRDRAERGRRHRHRGHRLGDRREAVRADRRAFATAALRAPAVRSRDTPTRALEQAHERHAQPQAQVLREHALAQAGRRR